MSEITLGKFGIIDIVANGYSLGLVPGCNIQAELALRPSMNLMQADVDAINALAAREWTAAVIAAAAPAVVPLADAKLAAIAKTYRDVDAVYDLAVGNREEEYKDAEVAARAFKAAGYAGPVSLFISGWATSQTPVLTSQQAADAIIAKADALAAAKIGLRNVRFTSQSAMRAATTRADLDAAMAAWDSFIASIKATL